MVKNIKAFYFQNAKYLVSDGRGNSVVMKMNYKGNKFKIEKVTGEARELFWEAEQVAKRLLVKKHNVNFVERLEI